LTLPMTETVAGGPASSAMSLNFVAVGERVVCDRVKDHAGFSSLTIAETSHGLVEVPGILH
jgi:hypothetical protein